jgi:hypothetical protein
MNTFKKSLVAAALLTTMGVSAASAGTFYPANTPADPFNANLTATEVLVAELGITTRKGDTLTSIEVAAIEKIASDLGNTDSKKSRINRIVNGDSKGTGPGYNVEYIQ